MITYIVPTLGRPSLAKTLASIETWPGDEILVVGGVNPVCSDPRVTCIPCPPGNDWGHSERNYATPMAKGRYIAHIDDDDCYARGTRSWMADAIEQTPGRPVIFRMRFPNGITLWREPEVRCGNLGTPCFLIPNMPERLGRWEPYVGGDCAFLEQCHWDRDEIVWRPEVIAHLGHNV